MERITIKAYAVKHKLSMFNVMKMIKTGEVKSEVFNEKGREVTYILYDDESEKKIEAQIVPLDEKEEDEMTETLDALSALRAEVKALREEVEALKKQLG